MRNFKLYGLLLGVALLNSCATTKNYSYDGKGFKNAYNSITTTELKKNLYVIADDKMEGRNTGSAGQKKAGEYIIEQYKKNGIGFPLSLGSYYQKVPSSAIFSSCFKRFTRVSMVLKLVSMPPNQRSLTKNMLARRASSLIAS